MVVPISLLPAIWSVVAGFAGISTAAVAMISATLYVIVVKTTADAVRMSVGFVLGVVTAVLSLTIISMLPLNFMVSLTVVMIVMVALVIIVQSFIPKIADLFSWLCGFAVAMTVFGIAAPEQMMTLAWQLVISMLAGIWWIGFVGVRIMAAIAKPPEK